MSLCRHFGIEQSSLISRASCLDSLLTLPTKGSLQDLPPYGTGEEANVLVIRSFDTLSKMLRGLSDLPLTVTSVQGVSPIFRYTEVVTYGLNFKMNRIS